MNLEHERMKMKDILDKMTVAEFDDMLEHRGINTIKPSHMSSYVLSLSGSFQPYEYFTNNKQFISNHYKRYNDFELEGQDAA